MTMRLTPALAAAIAAHYPLALAAHRGRMAERPGGPDAEVLDAAVDALFDAARPRPARPGRATIARRHAWYFKTRLRLLAQRSRPRTPRVTPVDPARLPDKPAPEDCRPWGDDELALAVAAIDRLPADQAGPIRRHFLGGETREAIAAALGIPPEFASARIRIGLLQLRTLLDPGGPPKGP